MYEALLVDLDDTLIRSSTLYNRATKFVATYLARKYSLDLDPFYEVVQEKHQIVQRNFPTVHTRHSRILVFRMALDQVVQKYDLSLLPDIEDMYWNFFLDHITTYPEVESTLTKLKDHNIKIGVVSDGSLNLRIRKIKKAGLLHLIDEVIASEEVIFEKPFSAIFTLALSRLGIEASEAIMVGNNFKNDIRGAQLIGIRTGLYDPPVDGNVEGQDGTIKADFVISAWSELLPEFGI
ncbi:HAD-IA family hydrolase [Candidatus Nomurabacteria bacterium]|uniref:HAD-IA family hydrolase n=1 Tax=Candidatus Dojkabacteria bacterium TaxID=2099670 RepID=A0A955I0A1_9BACT|nr:HAD-IA family hydrolase [Candidatus Dojkabacteria bacterium]MCB9789762.1 HAD-IA family hydrolase [Candidatus Nomurabacteria bacterium]MCB9803859.1 HAD-IA family hydrolase [Candidatus Nomurabacteria bacterium]